tara:strand:- start:2030 stop:3046 length:1017 start_codon:yes stop_codon:yes gene_type:complete
MISEVVEKDCRYILKNTNLTKFNKSKVLILGGNSFIASYIQATLSFINCDITSISLNKPKGVFKEIFRKSKINFYKLDLNDVKKFKKLLNKKFDFIFHCATYGQPKKWHNNELSTVNLNINILKLIIDHSIKHKSRILYLSSALVYAIPKKKSQIISEVSEMGVGTFPTEKIYACSKLIAEQICKIYKKKYNLPIYVARPGHTYGPGQDLNDPRVIPQILKRAIKEKKIYIYDKGKTIRTWGYIADITIMLLDIIQFGKSTIYNVSGKNHKSVYEICQKISNILNIKKIEIKNKNLSYTHSKYTILKLSSKKYQKEFKYKSFISLKNGLKRMIEWNRI